MMKEELTIWQNIKDWALVTVMVIGVVALIVSLFFLKSYRWGF